MLETMKSLLNYILILILSSVKCLTIYSHRRMVAKVGIQKEGENTWDRVCKLCGSFKENLKRKCIKNRKKRIK